MDIKDHPEVKAVIGKLDDQLNAFYQDKQIPGMAAGLVDDQGLLWSKGYGYANLGKGIPVDSQTVFDIGSVVKMFTDTALMMLRDAGKLDLDDPIEQHLPEFKIKNPFKDPRPPTFRQAAAHIAGIPRESGYVLSKAGQPSLPPMDEVLKVLADKELVYPPMSGMHYSNLSIYIIGHALGRIAGQPFNRVWRRLPAYFY